MLRGMTGKKGEELSVILAIFIRYRQTVIHNLPQLEKLDNISITSEERVRQNSLYLDLTDFCFVGRCQVWD